MLRSSTTVFSSSNLCLNRSMAVIELTYSTRSTRSDCFRYSSMDRVFSGSISLSGPDRHILSHLIRYMAEII